VEQLISLDQSKHVHKSIELDPEQRTLLEKKIKEIENDFIEETKNADRLKTYLGEQRKNALLAEKIEEDELKRQGTSILYSCLYFKRYCEYLSAEKSKHAEIRESSSFHSVNIT
jgi:pyrimidine operon attenuation protein/uracil phosphoribosyltransferase